MKQLIPISKSVYFQFDKFILIGHFHVLLTHEHCLTYNQNDRFAFFLIHK